MGWVIWRIEPDNSGNERTVFVRRITPNFVSFTVDRADARTWPSRAEARRALKGTGLTAYQVTDPDAPEAPVPAEYEGAPVAPVEAVADPPADDGPPFT